MRLACSSRSVFARLNDAWRRWPVNLRVGIVLMLFQLLIAMIGPIVAPYGYAEIGVGVPATGSSWNHPMGIDQLGRDVLSRVLFGARIVLPLAVSGTLLGVISGAMVGSVTAYMGGWTDELTQRIFETLISVPYLVLGLIVVSSVNSKLSGSAVLLSLVVGLVYFPRVGRISRAAAFEFMGRDFITIARLRGEPAWSVVLHELLPNTAGTLIVEFAVRLGYAPVLIGAFGFLGFGLRPPIPEWGGMISENRDLLLAAPVTVIGPGSALALMVISFNIFSDGVARAIGQS
jgi:peptide/nickel transport system permease protein